MRRGGLDVHRKYESLDALVKRALAESGMSDDTRSSRRETAGSVWHGGTWTSAVTLAQNGDMEGAKRLAPAILKGANSMMNHAPRLDPVYSIEGGRWIDIARYVHGEPECWGDLVENDPAPRRGLAIVINPVASADVSSHSIDKLGVEIGGAVLGLQALGYSVSVFVACKNRGSDFREMIDHAPLNPYGQPLDVSRLSVILRPWFLRRILFSIWETMSATDRNNWRIKQNGGYGSVSLLTEADARLISGQEKAISIDVQSSVNYPADVKNRILRAIDRASVPA